MQFVPITDTSRVKDRIVIGCPTYASRRLVAMFTNQIAAENEIREHDEAEEEARGQVSIRVCSFYGFDIDVRPTRTPSSTPAPNPPLVMFQKRKMIC